MSPTSSVAATVHDILANPTSGVVGVVNDLLAACREHQLQIDWQGDRCRVRTGAGDWEELSDIPLKKSAFRAILARLATLSNEASPNSVSPYGGRSKLPLGRNVAGQAHFTFVNTAAEQKLELTTELVDNSLLNGAATGVSR